MPGFRLCTPVLLAAFGVLGLAACRKEEAQGDGDEANAPPAAALARVAEGAELFRIPVTDPVAFDLVAGDKEAMLVLATPAGGQPELRFISLGLTGERRSEASTAAGAAEVVEVAAASAGTSTAAAWIEKSPEGAVARAVVLSSGDQGPGPVIPLGDATLATTERGHVALGARPSARSDGEEGRFVAFVRGGVLPCSESATGCTEFALFEIDQLAAVPRRVTLSVPAPCGRGIAGFAAAGSRWYYGVCAIEDGRAATTIFTIEHSPAYAQANRVLEGCVPLGFTSFGARTVLAGRCGTERRAVEFRSDGAEPVSVPIRGTDLRCEGTTPVLVTDAARGTAYPLEAAVGGIAPLLPSSLAVDDSRAVWTGKAVLVATSYDGAVVVRAFTCSV